MQHGLNILSLRLPNRKPLCLIDTNSNQMNGGHINCDTYRRNVKFDVTEFSIKKLYEELFMTGIKTGH